MSGSNTSLEESKKAIDFKDIGPDNVDELVPTIKVALVNSMCKIES